MTVTDHFITGERCTAEERLFASDEMIQLALEAAVELDFKGHFENTGICRKLSGNHTDAPSQKRIGEIH
ncbi:MAG: hypothetical protein R3E31_20720 [Chloroflexota bacterium]